MSMSCLKSSPGILLSPVTGKERGKRQPPHGAPIRRTSLGFTAWCAERDLPPIPAAPETVAAFLAADSTDIRRLVVPFCRDGRGLSKMAGMAGRYLGSYLDACVADGGGNGYKPSDQGWGFKSGISNAGCW